MAKRKKNSKLPVTPASTGPMTDNPFASLLAGMSAPDAPAAEDARDGGEAEEAEPTASNELANIAKVVLRKERKGRAGKTVTIIEGLAALPEAELETIARQVRKAVGAGAGVEDDVVVVQGDHRKRLRQWFTERGVSKVV